MNVEITISYLEQRCAHALANPANDGVVDEVPKTKLIRVLEFEFVVVGKETKQGAWCEEAEQIVGVLNELVEVSLGRSSSRRASALLQASKASARES